MAASSSGEDVRVGKLRFATSYRRFGGDHGPAVEVFGEVEPDRWREVARYDCFVQEPHRHFFHSDGREDRASLGTATLAESLCVCVDELKTRLPSVLARIGYPELAGGLGPDYERAVDEVDRRLRSLEG